MRQQQPGQKSAARGQSHRRPRIGVGGGHHGFGRPVEKAKDFRGTLRRLVRYVRPHYKQMMVVFVMAILSTAANLASPKIMGKAITKLFAGAMEKLQGVPGATIDFAYVGRILIILAGLYLFSALFSYLQ